MKKTILITGSTDGIGKLAAIKLAKAGHAVFLHGRNPEKLARVIAEVKRLTGTDEVDGFVADFSDLAAVGSMATEVSEALPVLDVLINNAGVYKSSQAKSKAGYDLRFAVNYLAPFTLTEGLLPLLRASGTARVINLSSAAQAPVDVAALKGSVLLPTQSAYAQSKLALTMWSAYLAEREPTLEVIAVNPGSLLDTRMVREGFGFSRSSPDKGAKILSELAVDDRYSDSSGKYFDNDIGAFGRIHPAGTDPEAVASLIRATTELVK